MTSFDSGRRAEAVAAHFLQIKGCAIVAQNWRNRFCEIDIIATRGGAVFLCEVKYRKTSTRGRGLEYVTPKKLAQMRLAARHWCYENSWTGPLELCAIEVSGENFQVTNVIKGISY